MSITATVTAKTGPGLQVTANVFTGVSSITFNPDKGTVELTLPGSVVKEFSLTGVTTFTVSISGTLYTVTIS